MGLHRSLTAATVLALSLTLAACGDGGSSTESANGTTEETGTTEGTGATGLAAGEDYSVLGALAELPDISADGTLTVSTGDLVGASELAGLTRPDGADDEELVAWIGGLIGAPQEEGGTGRVYVPLAALLDQGLSRPSEVAEDLGWSVRNVDAYAEVDAAPHRFTVVVGDFDEQTLAGLPEAAEGVSTAGEGEDLSSYLETRTPARPLGQPLRMAQEGSTLVASLSTASVQQWNAGGGPTLADHESYAAVAGTLDDAGVVGAYLGPGAPFSPATLLGEGGTEEAEAQITELTDQLVDAPFDVVGLGFAVEDGETVVTVAYHFATEAAADEAAPVLEKLYAEGRSVQGGVPISDYVKVREVAVDDTVAVVTLDVPADRPPNLLLAMFTARDLPFMYG